MRCWGRNSDGELGRGNTTNANTPPATDVNVGGVVTQVVTGWYHTCALLASGTVRCWGRNNDGQLGYADTADHLAPPDVDVNVGGTVTQIAAGYAHTCALLSTGSVRCWGLNDSGQLGYGDIAAHPEFPPADVNVGGAVAQISAGSAHTCALLTTGGVRCWGEAGFGRLGYGGSTDLRAPSGTDVNVGGPVAQIVAGRLHTCAVLTTGSLRCWGAGLLGRLGYGNTTQVSVPSADVDVGGDVVQVSHNYEHTCAQLASGGVRCWGMGTRGRLGYGNTTTLGDNEVPSSVGDVPNL